MFPEHKQRVVLDNVTVVVDAKNSLMSSRLQARRMLAVAHITARFGETRVPNLIVLKHETSL